MRIADSRLRIAEWEEVRRAKSGARNSALRTPRSAFTLMELLIVITIISILAGIALSGLVSAVNDARVARTRAQINKIDALIMERHESYRTRPVRVPPQATARDTALARLYVIRELMRFELPDRITDVTDGPSVLSITPSVTQSYRRLALRATNNNLANWTRQHQGSECLYLILATMKDGDKSALEFFTPDEIGDVDGDGMKEILDGFGQPIEFLRWAPGYSQHPGPDGGWGVQGTDDDGNGTVDDIFEAGWPGTDDFSPPTLHTRIGTKHPTNPAIEYAPDSFDPLRVDPRLNDSVNTNDTYYLKPLIFSAGLNKEYHLVTEIPDSSNNPHRYAATAPPNDPYYSPPSPQTQMGSVVPGGDGWADNITNHFIEPQ